MPGLSSLVHQPPQLVEVRVRRQPVPAGRRASRARGAATAGPAGGRRTGARRGRRRSASAQRPCSSRSRARTPSWYAVQIGVSRSSLMRSACGDRLLRVGEAPLLDVVVAEVAHRRRRQVVEPVLQADVGGGEQVGPPAQVALEQARHRDPDGRGAAQHDVAVQLVRDPRGAVSRPSRLRGVAAPRRRGRRAGPGRSRAPAGRRRPRGSRRRPSTCRAARARSAAYQAKPASAVCAAPTATTSPMRAPQLQRLLPRRDGVAEPVGEVQVERTAPRAGRRGWRCRRRRGAARSRRRRRPPGAPRSGTPRPPRRARTAGSGGRRRPPRRGGRARSGRRRPPRARRSSPRAAPARSRARSRSRTARPGDLVAERDAAPVPVDQAGGGEHPDRRRRHAERVEQLAGRPVRGCTTAAPGSAGPTGPARRSGRARRRGRSRAAGSPAGRGSG